MRKLTLTIAAIIIVLAAGQLPARADTVSLASSGAGTACFIGSPGAIYVQFNLGNCVAEGISVPVSFNGTAYPGSPSYFTFTHESGGFPASDPGTVLGALKLTQTTPGTFTVSQGNSALMLIVGSAPNGTNLFNGTVTFTQFTQLGCDPDLNTNCIVIGKGVLTGTGTGKFTEVEIGFDLGGGERLANLFTPNPDDGGYPIVSGKPFINAPEPSSLFLLGLGVFGAFLKYRKEAA